MTLSRLAISACALSLLAGDPVLAANQAAPAPAPAQAKPVQQAPIFRPCTASDIIGTWQMVDIDENPPGSETQSFEGYSKYQYINFTSDSVYLFAYTNVEYKGEKNIDALLNLASKSLGQIYTLENSVLTVKDSKGVIDQNSCNIVLRDVGKFRKDQLVLSQGHKKPVPTQITRMYKKMFTK